MVEEASEVASLSLRCSLIMILRFFTGDRSGLHSVLPLFVVAVTLLFTVSAGTSRAENSTNGHDSVTRVPNSASSTEEQDEPDYEQALRDFVARAFASIPASTRRKLLEADVRPECSVGLFRMMRAFQNLDPWALRLFDASGKYPSGLLQGTKADLGAFDECVETVVHDSFGREVSKGQYCSLLFNLRSTPAIKERISSLDVLHPLMKHYKDLFFIDEFPMMRIGICITNDCDEQDLRALIAAVKPARLKVQVESCATIEAMPMTRGQASIIAVLAVLGLLIGAGSTVDAYMSSRTTYPKQEHSVWMKCLMSFSALSNTRAVFNVAEPKGAYEYDLSFLHGLRFFSVVSIVLGHCYGVMSETWSRSLNILIFTRQWMSILVTSGFVLVDTFFFLSGFLLCFVIDKQRKTGVVVFIFAVLRRIVRTMVPFLFIVMCMQLLPLMASGPGAKAFFRKLDDEVEHNSWQWVLQVRNLFYIGEKAVLPHVWYLSADFQLFVVALPVYLALRNRRRLAVLAFMILALFGCSVAAWQARRGDIVPFMVFLAQSITVIRDTVNDYYTLPFYHAVCYFTGCITYIIAGNFRQHKVSKVVQAIGWVVTFLFGACCVLIKATFYSGDAPTTTMGRMSTAFFDRIMWSLFLGWITLACMSGRGGFVSRFLSWSAFVPLSRLSFAVYLIHFPFIEFILHTSRERIFFAHFSLVTLFFGVLVWSYLLSYLAYIICEGPTTNLDKLLFGASSRPRASNEASAPSPKENEVTAQNGVPVIQIPRIVFDSNENSVANGTDGPRRHGVSN